MIIFGEKTATRYKKTMTENNKFATVTLPSRDEIAKMKVISVYVYAAFLEHLLC